MPVQFNLLPDIKFQYLKARRLQRLVVLASAIAVAACIVIIIILVLLVEVKQKHDISSLASDIKTHSNKVKSIDGLDKIITIQNQLETLPSLYQQDPEVSRLFGYITKLTPPNVTVGNLSLDLTADTMEIKGNAPALADVNSYTDALKQATYDDTTSGAKGTPAFSSVVLSSFGRDSKGASYTIDMSFDPLLFQTGEKIELHVPKTTNAPKVPGINGKVFKTLQKHGDQTQQPTNGDIPANSGGQ